MPQHGIHTEQMAMSNYVQLPGHVNFLQIDSGTAGLQFYDEGQLNFLYSESDFAKAKWHLVKGYLSSL